MVIIVKRYGALGNRLFLFAHLIANAVEHGYSLANPSFNGYARYFQAPATNDFGGLPIRLNVLPDAPYSERWLGRVFDLVQRDSLFATLGRVRRSLPAPALPQLVYLPNEDGYDLTQPDYLRMAQGPHPVLLHGWRFRDRPSLRKHAKLIRELFALVEPHRSAVAAVLKRARQNADVLVGVHVRRGDYATWHGGQYFYDDDTYAGFMRRIEAQFPAGTRVAFLISSNFPPPPEPFAGLQIHYADKHDIEDMYALAGCDYLIGPPSTYSMWASFYGEVPLLHLTSDTHPVPLAEFQVYRDQYEG
ncbi:hypothetical protein GCM10027048_21710 [Hymenobacter coalescens]